MVTRYIIYTIPDLQAETALYGKIRHHLKFLGKGLVLYIACFVFAYFICREKGTMGKVNLCVTDNTTSIKKGQ